MLSIFLSSMWVMGHPQLNRRGVKHVKPCRNGYLAVVNVELLWSYLEVIYTLPTCRRSDDVDIECCGAITCANSTPALKEGDRVTDAAVNP
jgi:hypothetical protein